MGRNLEFAIANPHLFPTLGNWQVRDSGSWPAFLHGDWPAESLSILKRFQHPHGNVWNPDTCGCVIHFFFEHEAPAEERVHVCTFIERACEHHAHLPSGHGRSRNSNLGYRKVKSTAWDAVLEENHRKNISEALAMQAHRETGHAVPHEESPETLVWSAGVRFQWKFDNDRALHVAVAGGSEPNVSGWQSALDKKFEKGLAVAHRKLD